MIVKSQKYVLEDPPSTKKISNISPTEPLAKRPYQPTSPHNFLNAGRDLIGYGSLICICHPTITFLMQGPMSMCMQRTEQTDLFLNQISLE